VHTITEHILTSDRSASKLYSKYVELSEDAISNDHFTQALSRNILLQTMYEKMKRNNLILSFVKSWICISLLRFMKCSLLKFVLHLRSL